MTAKENVTEAALSSESHIECPYTPYKTLHGNGQVGFDPEIGLAVVGYDDLVSLARLEARIAFEVLLTRLPNLTLDEANSDLSRLPGFASHGYERICLMFDVA